MPSISGLSLFPTNVGEKSFYAYLAGYQDYLRTAEAARTEMAEPQDWSTHSPYVVLYSMEKHWDKIFKG